MIYSGGEEHKSGIGVILRKRAANSIMDFWPVLDRVTLVKLKRQPINTNRIQVYTLTQDHSDNEIESFYEQIEKLIQLSKSGEVICIMVTLVHECEEGMRK